jgi:hypothetical protein
MKPLRGKSYTNIFTHYRPIGDPKWYLKPNPPGTPEPLMDIGECTSDGVHRPTCGVSLPYLSPTLDTVSNAYDLFKYWEKVSPSSDEVFGTCSNCNVNNPNTAAALSHDEF